MSTSSSNSRGPLLAAATLVLLGGGVALALLWAPEDADQGPSQRIFYLHVPVALTAYACFGWAAWKGLRLLWTRHERYDLESYTGVHLGLIFGLLTLVTGSIWAKVSWGVWWSWGERQLVLFLILFLFYSAYFMLRYSLEPGAARANVCAVYALLGVVLIPVSFLAIRLAENFIHPVVFTRDGPQMSWEMFVTFCVCLAGMLVLAATLYVNELLGKRLDERLRELRETLA
ncbi:MAG TPA: cytochrome c biogenesis protein [Gaiellaceae bacterium]|nr:cytochrome c biogenesis protein [Gaiellaceae bacterium]